MAAQTLDDVLSRTREFHDGLARCLNESAEATEDPRAELLLNYLSDHEHTLSQLLEKMQSGAERKQLDTWFYEFTQKHNVIRSEPEHKSFAEMTSDEIMTEVMNQHEEIIELYRYLYGRAGSTPAQELLRELVDFEQHEAMLLAQEGMRAEDM